ncbi:hypothetical protein M8J76_007354 [Diaphorina citri]|nr:hypothetical protein M8J75_011385 [Diaphorina citri]KAI5733071.1 hypothetical protein M8J76_007354 [Diaphorina citri]
MLVLLFQILCLCSHLYGVKVYHGTTQEESEEDQSEEEVPEHDESEEEGDDEEPNPEYDEDIDYTKFFPDKPKKPELGHIVEPFDLSQFFRDVDAGKYNRNSKYRGDPSESQSVNLNVLSNANLTFPDFFDASATNTFEEIVEKETDRHVGPAMTKDFDRLVEDIDFDIDMHEDRIRSERSVDNQNKTQESSTKPTEKFLKTNTTTFSGESPYNQERLSLKERMKRKQSERNKNGTIHEPAQKTVVKQMVSTEVGPKVSDYILERNLLGKNNTKENSHSISDMKKKVNENHMNKEYVSIMDKLNTEMKEKIMKSNQELMKKLNESNADILNKIKDIKKEYNIENIPDKNNNSSDMFNPRDNSSSMNMFAGDSVVSPKIVALNLSEKSSEELNEYALKEFTEESKESPRKRYATDAYFPEVEDYPSYDTSSDANPSYDDYESSSPASEEHSKAKSYDIPSISPGSSPYNPQNIPPSSSFAHMYRTFDNDQPLSTHYSTNHDPNHSSYESSSHRSDPGTYEPYSNFKYDPPSSFGYGSSYKGKSKSSKPHSMVEVDGDSPDMEYQRVKEPINDHADPDENNFDIDKFISDFNTDPPYSADEEEQSDEGGDEGEEGEGEEEGGEEETDEGETETRPQEYLYKKTVFGGKPRESNLERGYEKTRSSDFRPKKKIKTPSIQPSFGPKKFKNYFDNGRGSSATEKEIPKKINHPISEKQSKSKPMKKCVKTTKMLPGGQKKMKCKICENLKTGGKSEHCSYLVNPNKDNFVVGTEEVTYRTINSRRKRDVTKHEQSKILGTVGNVQNYPKYENGITLTDNSIVRVKREDDYDEDDEEEDEDENIEAEYGPEYDPYFGEPVGYKSSDGGSCRTVYDDDGSECRVCRNRKTNGEFKECSYTSKPQKQAYEFGSSKVYGSGKQPRFRRHHPSRFRRSEPKEILSRKTKKYLGEKSKRNKKANDPQDNSNHGNLQTDDNKLYGKNSEVSRLESQLLGEISKGENRAKEDMSNEDTNSAYRKYKISEHYAGTPSQPISIGIDSNPNSNEGGEYINDYYSQRENRKGEVFADEIPAESNFRSSERKRSDLYDDHFSRSFPELLDGKESLELPSLKKSSSLLGDSSEGLFSNRNSFSNNKFKSRGLLGDNGFQSGGLLDDKDFFKNNKLKLGRQFSDTKADARELFDDRDSDNLNRMFGEFAAKDRTNCKKRYKDKMTCYECVDENNIRQEECIYIKNSEPESKQVAYKETNQYNNPKAQSSEGRESRIYTFPTHEMFEEEYDTAPTKETKSNKKHIKKKPYYDNERPSEELEIDIKRKNPKYHSGSLNLGDSTEEMEAIKNMEIQKVPAKSKYGKRREQSYSGSSHVENVEMPYSNSAQRDEELSDASVSLKHNKVVLPSKNVTSNTKVNQTKTDVPDTQGEGSHLSENVDNMDEEPEEPETEGPEGAFSEETEPVYDPERKLELPRYMVEKSEGERIFDQISGM